mmetsp:Transcript_53890/g.61923  ORF Transcript_53890/g.61923 Transcript_53890/m.61923 type:complete len:202 (-) Transcript_53890:16-621(-)
MQIAFFFVSQNILWIKVSRGFPDLWSNQWILLQSCLRENNIDVINELTVVNFVRIFVIFCPNVVFLQSFELFLSQFNLHLTQHTAEFVGIYKSFSQAIVIFHVVRNSELFYFHFVSDLLKQQINVNRRLLEILRSVSIVSFRWRASFHHERCQWMFISVFLLVFWHWIRICECFCCQRSSKVSVWISIINEIDVSNIIVIF